MKEQEPEVHINKILLRVDLKMKKAQIQNMESVAVVIIIGIMIILGLVFAFNFKSDDIKKEVEQQNSILAFTVALRVSSLEELKCSSFDNSGNLCLDLFMLDSFSEYVNPQNDEAYKYYYNQFKTSQVIIHIIYPEIEDYEDGLVLFDYAPEPQPGKDYTIRKMFFPVTVLNPTTKVHHFSIMEVGVYS